MVGCYFCPSFLSQPNNDQPITVSLTDTSARAMLWRKGRRRPALVNTCSNAFLSVRSRS
jgi:hypothetical protein